MALTHDQLEQAARLLEGGTPIEEVAAKLGVTVTYLQGAAGGASHGSGPEKVEAGTDGEGAPVAEDPPASVSGEPPSVERPQKRRPGRPRKPRPPKPALSWEDRGSIGAAVAILRSKGPAEAASRFGLSETDFLAALRERGWTYDPATGPARWKVKSEVKHSVDPLQKAVSNPPAPPAAPPAVPAPEPEPAPPATSGVPWWAWLLGGVVLLAGLSALRPGSSPSPQPVGWAQNPLEWPGWQS